MENKHFPWKTIKLGTGLKTAHAFHIKILQQIYGSVRKGAYELIEDPIFTISEEEEDIFLIKISVEKLGFDEETPYFLIKEKASSMGFELCPPEVAPQLRIQYVSEQPKNEYLFIGMEEIPWGGLNLIFSVEHDLPHRKSFSWQTALCTREGGNYKFGLQSMFVFVLPKDKVFNGE